MSIKNLRKWTEQYANWKVNEEKIKALIEMGFEEKKAKVDSIKKIL